ncbi:MAG: hypothetical protein NVSMB21_19920 [Vulcanimicrobiaceae bacterium]
MRGGLAFVLACASTVALVRPALAAAPRAGERSPDAVIHAYFEALAALRRPAASSFDYTVSQLGLRDMEQTHRVYRSGLDERDETLAVDGLVLKAPAVRILRHRSYRYDIATVAPRAAQYAFAYAGEARTTTGVTYRFRTRARAPRAFDIVEIDIDGRSSLPSVVRFRVVGGGTRAEGTLRYGRSGTQWVIREARVTARLPRGTTARERIVWSNQHAYDALPKSTFDSRASRPALTKSGPLKAQGPAPATGVPLSTQPQPQPPAQPQAQTKSQAQPQARPKLQARPQAPT